MTRASAARLTASGSSGAAALEIIAGATKGLWLRRIEVTLAAATASIFGVGRPAAKGITPTAPVLMLPDFSADPTTLQGSTAVAWGTGPTVPANFYRQVSLAAAIGAQAIFTFDNGLWLSPGTSFVLWNGAANAVAYVNVIADENN